MELPVEALSGTKIGATFALAWGAFFLLFSLLRLAGEKLREHLAWRRSLKPWAGFPRAYGDDGQELRSSIDRRIAAGARR